MQSLKKIHAWAQMKVPLFSFSVAPTISETCVIFFAKHDVLIWLDSLFLMMPPCKLNMFSF